MSGLNPVRQSSPSVFDDFVIVDQEQLLIAEAPHRGSTPSPIFVLPPSSDPLQINDIRRAAFNYLKTFTPLKDTYIVTSVVYHCRANESDEEESPSSLKFTHKIVPKPTFKEQADYVLNDAIGEDVDSLRIKTVAVATEAMQHACSEPTAADVGASIYKGAPVISGVPRVLSWGVGAAVTAFFPTVSLWALGVACVLSYPTTESTPPEHPGPARAATTPPPEIVASAT